MVYFLQTMCASFWRQLKLFNHLKADTPQQIRTARVWSSEEAAWQVQEACQLKTYLIGLSIPAWFNICPTIKHSTEFPVKTDNRARLNVLFTMRTLGCACRRLRVRVQAFIQSSTGLILCKMACTVQYTRNILKVMHGYFLHVPLWKHLYSRCAS